MADLVNIALHFWEFIHPIISYILKQTTLVSLIAIYVGSKNVAKQIRISRQPLLVFKIQDAEINNEAKNIDGESQLVENVGVNTAVNVNIFRCFLDITQESFWYKHIHEHLPNFIKKRNNKNQYPFATVTLEKSLGTIKADGQKNIGLLPYSSSYGIFILQYQDMLGNYYQTLMRPQNGRGDFEKVVPPKKICSRNRIENTFIGHTEKFRLSRFLKNGYNI